MDRRGHYSDDWMDDTTHLRAVEKLCLDEYGCSLVDRLSQRIEDVRDDLRLFLTLWVGAEAVSRAAGIGWVDDMNAFRRELEVSIGHYNVLAKPRLDTFYPDGYCEAFPLLGIQEAEPDWQFLDRFRQVFDGIIGGEWGDAWLVTTEDVGMSSACQVKQPCA